MRLIDADDFLKRLNERPVDYIDPGCDFYYFEETVESVLNETPTVDAVEVVRCKDCRHRIMDAASNELWCDHCKGLSSVIMDNDFCSYGEREDNG